MPNTDMTIIKMGVALSIVGIILWLIKGHGITSGDWDLISNSYIALFPQILLTGVALVYILKSNNMPMHNNVLIGAVIGIGFALILGYFYDNNIWMDTVITGSNVLWEIQLITVVLWVIVGIIKGAVNDGS